MASIPVPPPPDTLDDLPLRELLKGIGQQFGRLVSGEVELARAEAEVDLSVRAGRARDAALAGVAAAVGFLLVVAALVLLLATAVAAWLAALLVAAPFFGAGGFFFWKFRNVRPRPPLQATRQTLKDDVEWIRKTTAR